MGPCMGVPVSHMPWGVDVPQALFVALFQKEQVLGHSFGDTSGGGGNRAGKDRVSPV